jgi:hypothetical protein
MAWPLRHVETILFLAMNTHPALCAALDLHSTTSVLATLSPDGTHSKPIRRPTRSRIRLLAPQLGLNWSQMFSNVRPDNREADLLQLENALQDAGCNDRIFSTDVPISGAKWSADGCRSIDRRRKPFKRILVKQF